MNYLQGRKIKIAMIANNLEINGISSVIMNYCSNLDLSKFELSIVVGGRVDPLYKEKCNELGIDIVALPNRKKDTFKYLKSLGELFREKKYDIVHIHGNQSAIALELYIAAKNGINVRIAHSHNTTCGNMMLHKLLKPLFFKYYTDAFACGEMAGKWLFGDKQFTVIPNGFITERFRFSEKVRAEVRNELNLNGKFVLGHIGRINNQKNQHFLLDIFAEVAKNNSNAVLLMVGTGPMRDEIMERVSNHDYKDRIIMYGETTTPEKLYMAMDCFVFPSKYEGLPVTLLEAQMSGLPCYISDAISDEVGLGDLVSKISLNENAKVWVEKMSCLMNDKRLEFFNVNHEAIYKYDIRSNAKFLEKKYLEIME